MRLKLKSTQTTLDSFRTSTTSDDIVPYGDVLADKSENVWHFGSQNMKGTHLQKSLRGMEEIDAMLALRLDTLAMQETNLSWTLENKLILNAIIDTAFGHGKSISASCPSDHQYYQRGGTAMIARGPDAERIHAQSSDKFGSFAWFAYRGKQGTGVIQISAYRVCQTKGTRAGIDTAKMQQYEAGEKSPDPRNNIFK